MLVKYVKGDNGHLRGVVVALGREVIGWSACCPKDKFDKKLGLRIASGRAIKGSNTEPPHYIVEPLVDMAERANKYYKPSA